MGLIANHGGYAVTIEPHGTTKFTVSAYHTDDDAPTLALLSKEDVLRLAFVLLAAITDRDPTLMASDFRREKSS